MPDFSDKIKEEIPHNIKTEFGKKIAIVPPKKNQREPIFGYDYLITDTKYRYSFLHEDFTCDEYRQYFNRVKFYSKKKICDLIGRKGNDRFKINQAYTDEMYDVLEKIFKKAKEDWDDESRPYWGHFHLYNNKRETKCPVIHFLYGGKGVFYIVCYDKYHKIH